MLFSRKAKKENPADNLVVEGSETRFMTEVMEGSKTTPFIAYFTATWCGPCKTLGPVLESTVRQFGGKVRLVKYDVDKNERLAAEMRVQSIPTVFGFVDGQPVDGFSGAVRQSEVVEFVKKLASSASSADEDAVEQAEALLERGAAVEAAQACAMILSQDPANARAYATLIRSYLKMGEAKRAEELLAGAPEEIASSQEIESVKASLELAKEANRALPLSILRRRVENSPSDHQSRYDLAMALHGAGDIQGAVDELLEIFRRDREWNDGAAKTQLFRIFDSLKANDPIALKGRRSLSSMIFS